MHGKTTSAESSLLSQYLPSLANLSRCDQTLLQLFEHDDERGKKLSISCGELILDFSKNHLSVEILLSLEKLTHECNLKDSIRDLLGGAEINNTEGRPAWHTALRASSDSSHIPEDIKSAISGAHQQMRSFVSDIHDQNWRGFTNRPITDVVNIGIGGSDLGPRMVCQALCDYHSPQVNVHFVANIDGAEIFHQLKSLDPETTLFIVASKSFTTLETLSNAKTARKWLLNSGCSAENLANHFVAISTNKSLATEFGISPDNIFPMWDWVGGRYSLWSAIGLPIALAIGWEGFQQLLDGAEVMDKHFEESPPLENMPVMLALITFYYSQVYRAESQAVLPYCHQLQLFPNFLQQLDMESLGKSVDVNGNPVDHPTGIALWGTEESNGQHSFHQLFHQGTATIPVDFIATLEPNHPHIEQHQDLLACCLSQSQALLTGKSHTQAYEELLESGASEEQARFIAKHKEIKGNRPSNTLLLKKLTPYNLGSLIALYEHKVYAQSVLLNINAFDQWGVELGKELAKEISSGLRESKINPDWDSSTATLANLIQESIK